MRRNEKNNFQDKAEEREFRKGFDKGKQSSQKRRRQGARERSFDYNSEKINVKDPVNTTAGNDPDWYNPDTNLFNGVTGITTQAANGLPIITGSNEVNDQKFAGLTGQYRVQTKGVKSPGVMVFDIVPSIGDSKFPEDPFNRANDAIFTFVRQNKSGQPIYEAPNLGMYNFAMANVYAFYEYIVRAYGILNRYSVLDWYTPKALITAMNLDYADLRSNIADFRNWINSFAYEIQQFASPAGIRVHDRYKFLFSNIYLDEASQKAQYYLFNPAGFWIWSEGQSDNPRHPVTQLDYQALTNIANNPTLLKFKDLQNYGDMMIRPLSGSQDVRNMSADIFTVFGANNIISVATIDEKYTVTPTYDIRAQQQIENMFIYGDTDSFVGKIYERSGINEGYIYNEETFAPSAAWTQRPNLTGADANSKPLNFQQIQPSKWVLNFHQDSISNEDVMEATRLSGFGYTTGVDEDEPLSTMNISTHGSEIVSGSRIWYYTYVPYTSTPGPAQLTLVNHSMDTMFYFGVTTSSATLKIVADQWNDAIDFLSLVSKFDWHPQIFVVLDGAGSLNPTTTDFLMRQDAMLDISNFAELTAWQLEQMNRIALYAEFACRDMGEFSRIINMK